MSVYQGLGLVTALLLLGVLVIMRFWTNGHNRLRQEFEESQMSDL